MSEGTGAMNRAGSVAYGAAVIALIVLTSQEMNNSTLFLYDWLTPPMFALGIIGWVIATFGPLTLSVFIWALVKRVHAKWAPHLLFIPFAIALFRGGVRLLGYATDWSDSMGVGMFMILAALLLCLTVLVHAASLIVELVKMFRRRKAVG